MKIFTISVPPVHRKKVVYKLDRIHSCKYRFLESENSGSIVEKIVFEIATDSQEAEDNIKELEKQLNNILLLSVPFSKRFVLDKELSCLKNKYQDFEFENLFHPWAPGPLVLNCDLDVIFQIITTNYAARKEALSIHDKIMEELLKSE